MKKILLPLATALVMLGAGSANAATATSGFNVKVDLTATCSVVTGPADVQFAYTSFGGAATASGGGFTLKCTNSLPYTFSVVGGNSGTFATVGLAYTLGFSAAGGTGNGANQSYSITGNMVANQAGTCNGAGAGPGGACQDTDARTLTITF